MSDPLTKPLRDLIREAKPGFACGDDPEDGVFQFRMNNVTISGGIDLSKKRRVHTSTRNLPSFLLDEGDVLFNSTNSPELVGKSAYIGRLSEPATYSNHFLRLRPNKSLIDGKYLAHWLVRQFQRGIFKGMCRQWVNQAAVSREALLQMHISIPSLREQNRVVALLDKADEIRQKREQAITKLDHLAQSVFVDMFGDPVTNPNHWPVQSLDTLTDDKDTINYGVVQPGDHVDDGVPLIRVGDLVGNSLDASTLKRIDASVEAAYKRSRLKGNEVLVSCVGSIGVVRLATPEMKGFNIARAVARIPVGCSLNRTYLAHYLKTARVQRYFTAELRTVSQPTLNIKQICETMVLTPPMALQERFERFVQSIESGDLRLRHSARILRALTSSIQHQVFAA